MLWAGGVLGMGVWVGMSKSRKVRGTLWATQDVWLRPRWERRSWREAGGFGVHVKPLIHSQAWRCIRIPGGAFKSTNAWAPPQRVASLIGLGRGPGYWDALKLPGVSRAQPGLRTAIQKS